MPDTAINGSIDTTLKGIKTTKAANMPAKLKKIIKVLKPPKQLICQPN